MDGQLSEGDRVSFITLLRHHWALYSASEMMIMLCNEINLAGICHLGVWSWYWTQLGSKMMSAADAHSLRAGVWWPRTPARTTAGARISRDAVDTRIPAVRWLSAAHHGLPAMPAVRALLASLLRWGVCWNGTPARADVFMTIVSHKTPATAVWVGAHLSRSQFISIPWPHPKERCLPYAVKGAYVPNHN